MPNEKSFDDYFDELASQGSDTALAKEDEIKVEDEPKKEEEVKTETVKEEEEKEEETPIKTDEDGKSPDKPVEEPTEEEEKKDYKVLYEATLAELHHEKHKNQSWEGRIRKANEKVRELEIEIESLKSKKPSKKESDDDDDLSDDNQATLNHLKEEFPDIYKMVDIVAEQKASAIVGKFKPQIQTQEDIDAVEVNADHLSKIDKAHPDARELVKSGKLYNWIESQPLFMQEGLMKVYNLGTATEVIELITAFKNSSGIKNTKSGVKNSNKKAESIIAVEKTNQPHSTKKVDKNDYDATWDELTSGEK